MKSSQASSTWSGLCGEERARAKAIPLGALTSITRNPKSTNVSCVIAAEGVSSAVATQRGAVVQERRLTVVDRRILTALERRGDIVSAKVLTLAAGVTEDTVRDRCDRLAGAGLVVSIPGRGYRLAGGVK